MSFAKRLLIGSFAIIAIPLKDFWAIVMLGGEYAHEPKAGGSVEIAWIEQDRGHSYPSLQLLYQ